MKKLFTVVLCLCFVLSMLAGCGGASESSSTDGSSADTAVITVPDFTGKTVTEVTENAEYKALCDFEVVYEHSTDDAKDTVFAQLPAAGETFKEKPTVTLTVSLGAKIVEIPNIYEKTMADARAELEEIGFTVIVYQEAHDTVKNGLVYAVEPPIGEEVADDSEVTIYVSTGAEVDEYTTLPDLVGLTQFEAERQIAEAGLSIGTVTQEHSDTVASGNVCEMSIEPGEVTYGAVVDLVVSMGPAPQQ